MSTGDKWQVYSQETASQPETIAGGDSRAELPRCRSSLNGPKLPRLSTHPVSGFRGEAAVDVPDDPQPT
jgi:hypothetical protein